MTDLVRPRVQCKFEARHSTHSRHWANTEMKLLIVALFLCPLTASAANTKNATILTLLFKGDVSFLNDTAKRAWRELTEARNQTLTDLGLNATAIRKDIEEGRLTEDSLRSVMRSASNATLQVDSSVCDALASKVSRNCSGTIADRTRAREVNDDLERQVKVCRSGYSALAGNSEETALLECLSTQISVRRSVLENAWDARPTLSKRDERTPQKTADDMGPGRGWIRPADGSA